MHSFRHHVSTHHDKQSALKQFHDEVVEKTEMFLGHTFFEIICPAPAILEVADVENYAVEWVDKGWSADVVSHEHGNGNSTLKMRLRSYVDAIPY